MLAFTKIGNMKRRVDLGRQNLILLGWPCSYFEMSIKYLSRTVMWAVVT